MHHWSLLHAYPLKAGLMLVLVLPFFISVSACSSTLSQSAQPPFKLMGHITHQNIPEASGLAVSRLNPEVLWVLNDSGNTAQLYAINQQGKHLRTININGVKNRDWEDLASFWYNNHSYLLIADVGDNRAKRNKVRLHLIKEPLIKPEHDPRSVNKPIHVQPKWSQKLIYEDGPRDSEAVAVDIQEQTIWLLSKRTTPPTLHQIPFQISPSKQNKVATKTAEINHFVSQPINDIRHLKHMLFDAQPTAMDISADGRSAIVLTYLSVYIFHTQSKKNLAELFASTPQIIKLPFLDQAEAITFDQSGQHALITSEGLPAPLYKLNLQSSFATLVKTK